MLWLLNIELNAVSAGPQRDLVPCFFGVHLQDCFRTRHPLTNAVHNAERYSFSSDFVDSAALIGFWAATFTITCFVARAWSPGWCRRLESWRIWQTFQHTPPQMPCLELHAHLQHTSTSFHAVFVFLKISKSLPGLSFELSFRRCASDVTNIIRQRERWLVVATAYTKLFLRLSVQPSTITVTQQACAEECLFTNEVDP